MGDGGARAVEDFTGAKLMLHLGRNLVVLRRDRTAGIPWPGYLDFPGGGREGQETPQTCAIRETYEEIGLTVSEDELKFVFLREASDGRRHWFFAAHLPKEKVAAVQFGNEGSGWQLMTPEAFVTAEDAIPHFRSILAQYLNDISDN